MEDKCFCHFNGFRVKDAEARQKIEELNNKINSFGESSDGIYHLDLPLGAIIHGDTFTYNNVLSDECVSILNDFFKNKILVDNPKNPTLIIHNTTDVIEEDGVTIENPSPRTLILTNKTEMTMPHTEDTILTLGSYSFSGYDEVKGVLQDNESVEHSNYYVLSINFDFVNGEYNVIECYLTTSTYSLTTKKYVDDALLNVDLTGYATEQYVNDAIANIEIPEGEGGGTTNVAGHYYMKIRPYVQAPGDQYPNYGTALSPGTASWNLSNVEGYAEILESIYKDVANGIQPILHLLVAHEQGQQIMYSHQHLAMELDSICPFTTEGGSVTLKFRHTMTRDGKIYSHSVWFNGKITDGKFVITESWMNYECVIHNTLDSTPGYKAGTLTDVNSEGATGTYRIQNYGKLCILQVNATIPANSIMGNTLEVALPSGYEPKYTCASIQESTKLEVRSSDNKISLYVYIDKETESIVADQLVYIIK